MGNPMEGQAAHGLEQVVGLSTEDNIKVEGGVTPIFHASKDLEVAPEGTMLKAQGNPSVHSMDSSYSQEKERPIVKVPEEEEKIVNAEDTHLPHAPDNSDVASVGSGHNEQETLSGHNTESSSSDENQKPIVKIPVEENQDVHAEKTTISSGPKNSNAASVGSAHDEGGTPPEHNTELSSSHEKEGHLVGIPTKDTKKVDAEETHIPQAPEHSSVDLGASGHSEQETLPGHNSESSSAEDKKEPVLNIATEENKKVDAEESPIPHTPIHSDVDSAGSGKNEKETLSGQNTESPSSEEKHKPVVKIPDQGNQNFEAEKPPNSNGPENSNAASVVSGHDEEGTPPEHNTESSPSQGKEGHVVGIPIKDNKNVDAEETHIPQEPQHSNADSGGSGQNEQETLPGHNDKSSSSEDKKEPVSKIATEENKQVNAEGNTIPHAEHSEVDSAGSGTNDQEVPSRHSPDSSSSEESDKESKWSLGSSTKPSKTRNRKPLYHRERVWVTDPEEAIKQGSAYHRSKITSLESHWKSLVGFFRKLLYNLKRNLHSVRRRFSRQKPEQKFNFDQGVQKLIDFFISCRDVRSDLFFSLLISILIQRQKIEFWCWYVTYLISRDCPLIYCPKKSSMLTCLKFYIMFVSLLIDEVLNGGFLMVLFFHILESVTD